MPVPAAIAGAAGEFAHNTSFLQKAVADLTPEQTRFFGLKRECGIHEATDPGAAI